MAEEDFGMEWNPRGVPGVVGGMETNGTEALWKARQAEAFERAIRALDCLRERAAELACIEKPDFARVKLLAELADWSEATYKHVTGVSIDEGDCLIARYGDSRYSLWDCDCPECRRLQREGS